MLWLELSLFLAADLEWRPAMRRVCIAIYRHRPSRSLAEQH